MFEDSNTYDSILSELENTFKTEIKGDTYTGWYFSSRKSNVDIFLKTDSTTITWTLGKGTIEAHPIVVFRTFFDASLRSQWDSQFTGFTTLHSFNQYSDVTKSTFSAPWPVAHREFLVISKCIVEGDAIMSYQTSLDLPEEPVSSGHVRGTVLCSGIHIKTAENPMHSEVSYLAAIDPAGSIPTFVVNITATAQPLCIDGLRKYIASNIDKLTADAIEMYPDNPFTIAMKANINE